MSDHELSLCIECSCPITSEHPGVGTTHTTDGVCKRALLAAIAAQRAELDRVRELIGDGRSRIRAAETTLKADLEDLRAREEEAASLRFWHGAVVGEVERLREALNGARVISEAATSSSERIRAYAEHSSTCDYRAGRSCTCGLSALLAPPSEGE